MNSDSCAVGIDIGGTKIAVGLVSGEGKLLTQETFPTDSQAGIPHACDRVDHAIRRLSDKAQMRLGGLQGIGVGCPGPMNRASGEILNPHTLPGWESMSLTQCLEDLTQLPVQLENDADAALLGECFVGAGQGAAHVAMLTLGTGVGGAAITEGRILRGMNDEHPEIGLMPILPDDPLDYSGVPGSLESLASGTGIARAGAAYGLASSHEVFEAAHHGHDAAQRIVQRAYRATALGCLALAHILCPERIILGGGVMDSEFSGFATAARQSLKQATLLPAEPIQIVKAQLGNDAGLVGAASLILR